jgi:hypothetical protein
MLVELVVLEARVELALLDNAAVPTQVQVLMVLLVATVQQVSMAEPVVLLSVLVGQAMWV